MTRLQTRVAKAGWGDHRFRGHAVYAELLGRTSLSQLLGLALGVNLSSDEGAFMDELAVSSTLADPHIWPLKLTRVAGAYGSSAMTGLASGLLATDGPLMGAGAVGPAAQWLHDLLKSYKSATATAALIQEIMANRGRLPGFGVPARRVDERVTSITNCVEARGRDTLPHWSLWSLIVGQTRREKLEPNLASAFSAAVLDLGFTPDCAASAMHLCLLPSFLANAHEGAAQRPDVLKDMPAQHLDYQGPARRVTTRASGS